MNKLKIGDIADDKPIAMTIRITRKVHQDLIHYAAAFKSQSGQAIDPGSLVGPMLARFMAADRAFRKIRRQASQVKGG